MDAVNNAEAAAVGRCGRPLNAGAFVSVEDREAVAPRARAVSRVFDAGGDWLGHVGAGGPIDEEGVLATDAGLAGIVEFAVGDEVGRGHGDAVASVGVQVVVFLALQADSVIGEDLAMRNRRLATGLVDEVVIEGVVTQETLDSPVALQATYITCH